MPYKRHFIILLFLLIGSLSFSSSANESNNKSDMQPQDQNIQEVQLKYDFSNIFKEKFFEIDKEQR